METPDSPTDETIEKYLTDNLTMLKIYAFKLTGDATLAAELLQETTVRVLCNADSYTMNINFKGWVTTIMYNLFLNECKRSSRLITLANETIFDTAYLDCYVDTHEIIFAIKSLPVEYSRVFLLYSDGYKYHEIAARLNIPIGTGKSRIHTARTRLQLLLKDYVR